MNRKAALLALTLALGITPARTEAQQSRFGGSYDALDASQQRLIQDWVARFNEVIGQDVDAGPFYDDLLRLSTKTTFDAVTHALMTSTLTDEDGASLGNALELIERMETVKGKVKGASGDQQFRMYVVLREDALEVLKRSREFRRGADNTVFHKGYPTNYRQHGGAPSIQISVARDGRRADIDVDYRSSSFPASLFNGHLSSSNSDVRAGNNDDRHNGRWEGLQSWWRGFFGLRFQSDYDDSVADDTIQIPPSPRVGDKHIDEMVHDFLTAWLIEGNVAEAMGYVSERAYPCVAVASGEELDAGMAPFQMAMGMKAAFDAMGRSESLEGVVQGVRLVDPDLRVVRQPYHSKFVIYQVRDRLAREFDCAAKLELVDGSVGSNEYGDYFGSVFVLNGPAGKGETVALLWAREDDFWKIVSYETEPMKDDPLAALHEPPAVEITEAALDRSFADAAAGFVDAWFSRHDYDQAFGYFSERSYACHALYAEEPSADAAAGLRRGLQRGGELFAGRSSLDDVLAPVEPAHSITRVMRHEREGTYALFSVPDAVLELTDCSRRGRDIRVPDDIPLEYGNVNVLSFRLRTRSGEAPVLSTLWTREGREWRIVSYHVEEP